MLTRFSDWLGHRLLKGGKRNWLIILSVFFVIIFPLILIAAFSYIRTHRDLTDFALSRRQAIASLAAATIKEKLDRLIDIGVSLATRVRFAELVGLGRWEEAIEILRAGGAGPVGRGDRNSPGGPKRFFFHRQGFPRRSGRDAHGRHA
ncbi:MAG: hypothetical protein HYS67_01015 [Deltaproteobacteria bacterium]|nr:hypothetical protein [Deltaproteobacteria bacterium]